MSILIAVNGDNGPSRVSPLYVTITGASFVTRVDTGTLGVDACTPLGYSARMRMKAQTISVQRRDGFTHLSTPTFLLELARCVS
ncbi:hypothetical protein NPIL_596061 [Nephila pilipes]|uniref:Uncharacterized protein n=1 Tax=Nephila pilipes TaxID=299642 RepID=A0A8X6R2L2_NEPPI|nr:hypothetical protein NPIL_596061 [Nephila pilipes]